MKSMVQVVAPLPSVLFSHKCVLSMRACTIDEFGIVPNLLAVDLCKDNWLNKHFLHISFAILDRSGVKNRKCECLLM